ncbi:MAG TPA: DegT/DnrJ/EryC1/StrS family aminotransferase [Burkholderiales bacterium]|nr:DegT/DnrJ/EryC1/StrS family aminotransferase [Burkholderiales bacterium]
MEASRTKVGITGCSGTLGSLVRQRLAPSAEGHCFEGDLRSTWDVEAWVNDVRPARVLHLAARVPLEQVARDPLGAFDVNVRGTARLCAALAGLGIVPWLFYASTSHVYESLDRPISEDDPLKPQNTYAETKHLGEQIVQFHERHGTVRACIGRIFSFYHPSQAKPFLYPSIVERLATHDRERPFALRGGNDVRDLSAAEDIVDAILQLMDRECEGIVNIGSGVGTRIADFVRRLSGGDLLGMQIELCDCDRTSLGLDPQHFEDLCGRHEPDAAIIVHVLGHACQLEEIRLIAERHGVTLIEDSCEALGTRWRGRHLGTFGAMGSFSFYYGHQLSTIEGGIITVSDRELYNTLLSLRAHGWARDLEPVYKEGWEREFGVDEVRSLYTFYHPGFNFRPTDLQAFLGLSQMRKAGQIVEKRQRNFELYRAALAGDFWCQSSDAEALSSFAYGTLVANRLEVYRHLRDRGVETRPLVCGSIGRQPFWTRRYGERILPNADVVHEFGLYLPNHARIGPAEVQHVVDAFREVAEPKPFEP